MGDEQRVNLEHVKLLLSQIEALAEVRAMEEKEKVHLLLLELAAHAEFCTDSLCRAYKSPAVLMYRYLDKSSMNVFHALPSFSQREVSRLVLKYDLTPPGSYL